MLLNRGRPSECRARHRDDHRGFGGRILLPRRHRRPAALPRCTDAIARAHQGRQSRPGSRRARTVAARRQPARRSQADLHLAARTAGGGDRLPAHCARRPGERSRRAGYSPATGFAGAHRASRWTAAAMTTASALEMVLAAVVLGLAVWTIAARDTFSAVAGFVAYGLLLALVWVRLDAVDVALSAAVAAALAAAVLFLPDPAPTLAPAAAEGAAATGLGNPVTNVLMAFRAMDTLLEKIVLLLALVGVWSLAPDPFWGGRPGMRHYADPQGVLAFLARLLPPVGIVFGIYILWVSADHPGGAFQGGTVLAAMWLLAMMAGLADAPPVSRRWLRLLLIAGPVVFLIVGLAGLWLWDAFLAYPAGHAKPLILAIEFAMVLTIAVTLGLLLAGAPERSAEP